MLPSQKVFAIVVIVMALASLIYGVYDLIQSNLVFGALKILFALFAAAIGRYLLRTNPERDGLQDRK